MISDDDVFERLIEVTKSSWRWCLNAEVFLLLSDDDFRISEYQFLLIFFDADVFLIDSDLILLMFVSGVSICMLVCEEIVACFS